MGWYAASGLWRRRAAISMVLPGTTPIDANVTIPKDWDTFWGAIDTSAANLRVVSYDGTLLSYSVDNGSGGAFDKTNRLGRIQIDTMTVPATASVLQIFLYFDPSSNQSTGAVATTITSAQAGYIELGRPGQHRLAHQPQTARARKPRTIIHKTVNEYAFIWIRYDGALGKRVTPGNSSQHHEEALYATISVQNAAAADQSSMYDTDQLRWVETPSGATWLRIRVKAGTTATNYTAVVLTRTVLPAASTASQQLETRIGIAVSDTLES